LTTKYVYCQDAVTVLQLSLWGVTNGELYEVPEIERYNLTFQRRELRFFCLHFDLVFREHYY